MHIKCVRMYNRAVKQIRFTKEGYEKLKEEHKTLLAQRKPAVEDLKKARDMGDLSENGYYKSARSKLSFIDARTRSIAYSLKHAHIMDHVLTNTVAIGNTVTLMHEKREITYQIVGDLEANPKEQKISLKSPIGKALNGKKVGDNVIVYTPSGRTIYSIIKISVSSIS